MIAVRVHLAFTQHIQSLIVFAYISVFGYNVFGEILFFAYLNVTPQEFFTFELDRPVLMNDLLPLLKQLRDDQLTALIPLLIQWIKDSGSTGAGESISNTKK